MALHHVWSIPLLTFVFSLLAFVISYLIAVQKGHVTAIWPYISDAGTIEPESCVFGQLINLSALFLGITVYLRHRQIIEFYWHSCDQRHIKSTAEVCPIFCCEVCIAGLSTPQTIAFYLERIRKTKLSSKGNWRLYSTIFLWIGYISAMGISIVANFQETRVVHGHYFGAFLAFTFGLAYTWAQTFFTYMMNPRISHSYVAHFRLLINFLGTLFYCSTLVCGVASSNSNHIHLQGELKKWTPEDEFFYVHLVATISEWSLAICFQLYILSFAIELRNARLHAPKLKIDPPMSYASSSSANSTNSTTSTGEQDLRI